jgi:SAM-dependent methyltransferase
MAESFGTDAERYDRARPRYPEALVTRIVTAAPGPEILDVGSGTGISARQFQAAGCRVLGVEPDARMAGLARQRGVEAEVATFEEWLPADRTFDAVVAGQAWHWVDPVAGVAKATQALRPGGLLAPFWNVFELPPDVAEAIAEVCERVMPDAPISFRAMTTQTLDAYAEFFTTRATDGIREAGGFNTPDQWRCDWDWAYTRDAWLDVMPTWGAFTRLPQDKLAEVLAAVGTAIDTLGGTFTMRYATVAVLSCSTS